jgi:AAA domain
VSRQAPDIHTAIDWAKAGQASMTRCPAHEDRQASLSVAPGSDGQPVVVHCHANCETRDVFAAAGISWEEVCAPLDPTLADDGTWTPKGNASHIYSYVDEQGEELFQALRVPVPGGKTFFQRRHDSEKPSGWNWSLGDTRRVLYRLPQVIAAIEDGRDIWIFEGEKDVERAWVDGKAATCNPMGAGKWRTEYGIPLHGAHVTIVADNDDPGRKHAREVADDLVEKHECVVRIMETPLANCKDYSAHVQHGGTDEMLVVTWTSVTTVYESYGLDTLDFLDTEWTAGAEIVPNVLAEANVVVLVGPEGHGKSLFMRQFAVCAAAGIHPFTTERMDPLRVMFIDAENPEFQQAPDWRRLVGIAQRHTHEPFPRGQLQILSEWRNEPDLTTPDGQAWLYERITAYRPQLVLMGPVQNIVGRDTKDDEVVRKFKHAVNNARAICGSAFIIEHHAPHRQAGDKERQMRPYGSSLFMKWPDIGYGLKPTEDEEVYDMYPFRKPRVRSRKWPEQMRWGKPGTLEFPWTAVETDLSGSTNVVPIRG